MGRPRARSRVAVLACAAALPGAHAPPATAAVPPAPWSVSATGLVGPGAPAVSVGPGGRVLAATSWRGRVVAASGGARGPLRRVFTTRRRGGGGEIFYSEGAWPVELPDGSALLFWIDGETRSAEPEAPCCSFVRMARRAPGARRFGRPRTLVSRAGNALEIREVAVSRRGRVALLYNAGSLVNGYTGILRFVGRRGLVSAEQAVDEAFDVAFARERAVVTQSGAGYLLTRRERRDGLLGAPLRSTIYEIGIPIRGAEGLTVATDDAGRQVLAFVRADPFRRRLQVARRSPGRRFSRPRTLKEVSLARSAQPVVTMTAGGRALVAAAGHGLWAMSPGGRWIRRRSLERHSGPAPGVRLAAHGRRTLLAEMTQQRGGPPRLRAALGDARGRFAPLAVLARGPRVVLGPARFAHGRAVVTWSDRRGVVARRAG